MQHTFYRSLYQTRNYYSIDKPSNTDEQFRVIRQVPPPHNPDMDNPAHHMLEEETEEERADRMREAELNEVQVKPWRRWDDENPKIKIE